MKPYAMQTPQIAGSILFSVDGKYPLSNSGMMNNTSWMT